MPHRDRIFFDDDFLDQQADDFLFFGHADIFGRLFQPPQKTFQRLIELLELRIGQRLPLRTLQLLLRRRLFLAQDRHPLPQLRQAEQTFLKGIEELVDLLPHALQILLQSLPALFHRIAPRALVAPALQFRSDQGGPFEQLLHLLPYGLIQILHANGAARAGRGPQMPPTIRTQAPIISGLALGRSRGGAIE